MTTSTTDPGLTDLGPILADLDGEPRVAGLPPSGPAAVAPLLEGPVAELAPEGWLVLTDARALDEPAVAAWRNALWPALHLGAWYRTTDGRTRRTALAGAELLAAPPAAVGTALAFRRREHVLSPEVTVAKFDQNAEGWNGMPGKPGYGHHRWMRRFVGRFQQARDGDRILDFGCGAGWVGIEAAEGHADITLSAFDPSPEMVRITAENARAAGIARFEGRTGFGEDPPFPAAGEGRYELVISSGVVSFSPDFERWMEGLARAPEPGGTLVVGDINPHSRGMRKRRRTKALLPIRELNGVPAARVRTWLEARGYRHRKTAGYQLTWPVPQAMHFSETRLGGKLDAPLLLANRLTASFDRALGDAFGSQFDSWVMAFEAPR